MAKDWILAKVIIAELEFCIKYYEWDGALAWSSNLHQLRSTLQQSLEQMVIKGDHYYKRF